jgi:hypothetical protein
MARFNFLKTSRIVVIIWMCEPLGSLTTEPSEIKIGYTNNEFQFEVIGYDWTNKFIVPQFVTLDDSFDKVQSFAYPLSNSNIFQLVYPRNTAQIDIVFSKDCLFPLLAVSLNSDPIVKIVDKENKFSIQADFIGNFGFNRTYTTPLESISYNFSPINNKNDGIDIFSQSIDFSERLESSDSYSQSLVYCPIFASGSKGFLFNIVLHKRSEELSEALSLPDDASSFFSKSFIIPFFGRQHIFIPNVFFNTKFTFNTTKGNDILITFTFNNGREIINKLYKDPEIILPALKDLNISISNSLPVPSFVLMQAEFTTLKSLSTDFTNIGLILGLSIGAVALLIILSLLICFRRRISMCCFTSKDGKASNMKQETHHTNKRLASSCLDILTCNNYANVDKLELNKQTPTHRDFENTDDRISQKPNALESTNIVIPTISYQTYPYIEDEKCQVNEESNIYITSIHRDLQSANALEIDIISSSKQWQANIPIHRVLVSNNATSQELNQNDQ